MASQSEPLSASAVRAAERITMRHTPESVLMDRAAAAVAHEAIDASHVALLVGRGNNGGDALLAGAQLAAGGAAVTGYANVAALLCWLIFGPCEPRHRPYINLC